ncbi:ABC transporter ATP-binding protein [Alkaliphilus hydrothermalis]|uniref:Peptide/nickel transport system ATP-binding protein n=1 Tax=Alkaliphilus hydrothermalis TaxID=1482730 RepID=A0ABS2NNU8_9FIRM|nr:ABC transporter ATP-binding protein [Alkaliphilus hydrothermalis]MBM7614618.1 peptide/nickel transport system ATP-binding protein [Alkaliphilus hydrothermalis]
MNNKLLEVKNLHTYFFTNKGTVKAVQGVDFTIEAGKTLGIVGESGSGKSVTSFSILNLLDHPGKIVDGEINFNGKNLVGIKEQEMRHIRGNDISMIFQEPMTSLNPVHRIGRQISEPIMLHQGKSKKEAWDAAVELLREVKIPNPESVVYNYPFQLSGGMRQRVMIAMALACEPKLLIADEPTTALDVTIQAQIFKLMNDLKRIHNTAIIFITHDLGAIAELADDVAVMYTGEIVERAPVDTIFDRESKYSHPYKEGLLKSIPLLDEKVERLDQIKGSVPHPLKLPKGCRFSTRCEYSTDKCVNEKPELVEVASGHLIRCFYPETGCRNA